MTKIDFQTTRRVISAPGSITRLGPLARELGITHALVITDAGIYASGLHQGAIDSLHSGEIRTTLWHEVVADPPEKVVLEAVAYARELKIDGVIGFGGGSSMDVAKVIAVLANSPQKISEIYGVGNVKGN
jgi:alcohol dehydrogenase class IV